MQEENSMKAHLKTRCNKETIVCYVPEVNTNGVFEEPKTRKSCLEVEETSSEPARHQSKLPAFHESEPSPSTGTHHLKSSQSMFVVNEILETVLENVMEVHLDIVTEVFFVVDENGEDIEDIGKDLQYDASDESLMINFSSGIGFEGLTSETLMESTRKSFKKRLVVENESTTGAEVMTVRIPTKRFCPFLTSPPYCIFHSKEGHALEGGQEVCADDGGET